VTGGRALIPKVEQTFVLFALYASADAAWVKGYLLPALGLPDSQVILEEQFSPGRSRIDELARAVGASRFTVVVVSPAFLADTWAGLGKQLAAHLSVEERRNRLIPALLQPCKLPLDLAFRVPLDYTREPDWERETARLRAELGRREPEPLTEQVPCPYPGLIPYTEAHAGLFFGRDTEIRELLRRVPHLRLVMVIGPSGSGKSSLVLAGLVPELRRREPGAWLVRVIRPGAEPLQALRSGLEWAPDHPRLQDDPAAAVAALLARHPSARRLLLIIDQFEEVLGQAAASDREQFVAIMHALRGVRDCLAVLTLRADFYPELMHSELWPVAEAERLEVVPPRPAALRQAIEQPARQRGVYLEAALVERLLADAAREPGVLPLLQETLRQLWGERHQRLLTAGAYEALGRDGASGMAVALATWADASLAELPAAQQAVAQRVFLRLVHLGEGRDDTRRQQPVAALRVAGEDPWLLDRTLHHLSNRRLLIRSGREREAHALVDLAHEALIASWPTLQRWVTEGREAELFRRRIERDAEEWRASRDRGLLYRGRRLRNAREWQARYPHEPSGPVRAFLAAGRRLDLALKTATGLLFVLVAFGALRVAVPIVREAQLRREAVAAAPMVSFPGGPAVLGGLGASGPQARQRRTVPAFSIDKYEVTNGQYQLCVRANRCSRPLEPAQFKGYDQANPDLPVVYVTAYQAAGFCRWQGNERRLPSSAEWERAARGTDGRPWPWGTAEPSARRANVSFDKPATGTVGVHDGRFADGATPEGITGLIGNVAEWTSTPGTCEKTPYNCQHLWNGRAKVDVLEVRTSSFRTPALPVTSVVGQEAIHSTGEVGFRCAHSNS
jgi:formylglycine-generating enzyme required for sulfatase activity